MDMYITYASKTFDSFYLHCEYSAVKYLLCTTTARDGALITVVLAG